ncbi:bifunctional protein PutA [Devosia pacifica]|uniref:Bifunctional protein PutA n=1 Tax=Devosia pacifica TaxID=1335967 RepID=A0A918SA39_9HYPH|nr:bifunctional proline dehydrogenase/L-glutamate gamma-semialdehyde dehydrogenase PutA [Devosia pacifica]GHA32288.1 bifunctional protein PutA [Devosia pacifica]
MTDTRPDPATQASPFSCFLGPAGSRSRRRPAIEALHRTPETVCMPPLIEEARVDPELSRQIRELSISLASRVRHRHARSRVGGVDGLMREYDLTSEEGVALMCLAEALLRTPDDGTRDALIRDKIAPGHWRQHVGRDRSLFVNAATWGLALTGRLVTPVNDRGLGRALSRLLARSGEPVIRAGVDYAMRMMGEQFVAGKTIAEALEKAGQREARGYRYSYDMLGEAAMTAADAERYLEDYRRAIRAVGENASASELYERPGISIKLSALHPRYERAQIDRVRRELFPRLADLAVLARRHAVGLNIDAEESERLDLSLEALEMLCSLPQLEGWHGIGFVAQAYSRRCPAVIDHLIDLARQSGHRLMVRLVKGAYWDSEIKAAQVAGLEDYPVYTRKVHTDVAYIACARRLLKAGRAVYPQFATHNAQTLATIMVLAGPDFTPGDYEFQCLYGMGEALYDEVLTQFQAPCRIYAPVGSHETLLAYLVRRLLENGANSSFVNRIADPNIPLEELAADPVEIASAIHPLGAPHPRIVAPARILGARENSKGLDLASEPVLETLSQNLASAALGQYRARPPIEIAAPPRMIVNPANPADIIGPVQEAAPESAEQAIERARRAGEAWAHLPVSQRADCLRRAADLMQERLDRFAGLAIREAGKTIANAVAEVREAIDFLRFYAERAEVDCRERARPLGVVLAISPWNFPLAIFTGQIAAALVSGNTVVAKPAEQTPLIAAEAAALLHEAGVPEDALLPVPGDGELGAALVACAGIAGVVFTGSLDAARSIQKTLSSRLLEDGQPVPLIAETGGQNAMVVDSSALPEQVVADVLTSAFDSAGQRCSALRVLCLQHDIADQVLDMLKGAMAELRVGDPAQFATDIGPIINADACAVIADYVEAMRAKGHAVTQAEMPMGLTGHFIAPVIIELDNIEDLGPEVFGPVLHVVRYESARRAELVDAINALGYGLTFGIHSRIDTTIEEVTAAGSAGNIYVNRNQVGAVVGVQPFGGHGLSGTGPKAGGDYYVRRFLADPPDVENDNDAPLAFATFLDWLRATGQFDTAMDLEALPRSAPEHFDKNLPGPVGERNRYCIVPRGAVLASARSRVALYRQIGAILVTGNRALVAAPDDVCVTLDGLPEALDEHIARCDFSTASGRVSHVLSDDPAQDAPRIAEWPGPVATLDAPISGRYRLDLMLREVSVSTNTAAAGGNAQLMAMA